MPASIILQAIGVTLTGIPLAAATFAINFAVSYVVTRAFGSKPPQSQDTGARQQVPPANNNSIPVVYGDAWLGGVFVDAVLSTDQKTMYYVLAISSISSDASATFSFDTQKFYYGDRLITFDNTDQTKVVSLTDGASPPNVDDKINGNLYISLYTSTNAGVITAVNGAAPNVTMGGADIAAALRWPASGRQMNGLAFAIVKLNYNSDKGTTGLQPITFYCKHYPKGGTVAKPGDVWYDYMTDTRYGAGMTGLVDSTSATALNTYSDQTITYTPAGGGSSTQARYRINGVVDTGKPVLDNVEKMLECCDSWMAYNAASGLWSIVINKAESSTFSFNDTNLIGEIRVSAVDINQQINQIQIEFPSKLNRDQPDLVYMETPAGLLYPNEPANRQTTTLEFTNDSVQAQYLGNRRLEQAREDLIVTITSTYPGIQVDAGDVVDITNADYGWTNKLFRVMKVSEATVDDGNLGATLELSEYNAVVYDDASITAFTAAPNSQLPSAGYISAANAPTVTNAQPSQQPPTFDVVCTIPATGRCTRIGLYYTTVATPADTDWKLWNIAQLINGATFTNASTYTFTDVNLAPDTYYFGFLVGNDVSLVRSAYSGAFIWSPTSAVGPTGPTGGAGPTGPAITGPTGSSGLVGIAALTAYKVQAQSDPAPSFTTPTTGSAVPSGWSSTVPAVSVGQVLWYIQGRFNANAVTVDGVGANSTAWTGPIAASIFQSIRSDNYNGPNPPTTANFGTLGWYLDQPSGNLYANAAYLRGELVTGASGSQRIEINKGIANQIVVYNSANQAIGIIGGDGSLSAPIISLDPKIVSNYASGIDVTIPSYTTASGTSIASAFSANDDDSSIFILEYDKSVSRQSSLRSFQTDGSNTLGANLSYKDGSIKASGYFTYGVIGGSATLDARICDGNYALNLAAGSLRFGGYTISPPSGSTSTFLRNDGTWAAAGSVGPTGPTGSLGPTGPTGASGSVSSVSAGVGISVSTVGSDVTVTSAIPSFATAARGSSFFGYQPRAGGTLTAMNTNANGGLYFTTSNSITTVDLYYGNVNEILVIYLAATSDRTTKHDIQPETKGLEWVKKLKPVIYRKNSHPASRLHGFVADEIEEITEDDETIIVPDWRNIQNLDYNQLIPPVVKSIQELSDEVESLKQQIETLQNAILKP